MFIGFFRLIFYILVNRLFLRQIVRGLQRERYWERSTDAAPKVGHPVLGGKLQGVWNPKMWPPKVKILQL